VFHGASVGRVRAKAQSYGRDRPGMAGAAKGPKFGAAAACRLPAMASSPTRTDEALAEVENILREYLDRNNLRKTPERFNILRAIYGKDGHFDAEQLYLELKNRGSKVSRATVYNTLDILVDCHLVSKQYFGDSITKYEKAYGYRQHDHLVCTRCGRILEFCDPRIATIQAMVEEVYGFRIDTHALNFYGECRDTDCAGRQPSRGDGPD
jgi:Fur family ferric uptake transcriptional regulator